MPRPPIKRAIPLAMTALLALPACNTGMIYQEQVVRTEDMLAAPGPFRPSVLRIHPLTHTEINANDQTQIVLHIEMKDIWGDTLKGVGQLQVQLRQERSATRIGDRGTRWDIDLRDIEQNVAYFDSATRTYRIILGGLPDWLDQAARDDQPTQARIRALFRTAKADGDPVVLQDEYLMR